MSKSLASKPGASARTTTSLPASSMSSPQPPSRPQPSNGAGQFAKKRSNRAPNSSRMRLSGNSLRGTSWPPSLPRLFHGVKLNIGYSPFLFLQGLHFAVEERSTHGVTARVDLPSTAKRDSHSPLTVMRLG